MTEPQHDEDRRTVMKQDDDTGIEPKSDNQPLKNTISWAVVIILTIFGAFALFNLTSVKDEFWKILIREHFPVVVGLPMAGLGALFVTLILKISTGSLEFEIAGLKFKGGAAPIVFWVICFLSIVLSIKLLWQI